MWSSLPIETILESKLKKELKDNVKAQEIFGLYVAARKDLIEDILDEIKSKIPKFTDHGTRHVANVLKNAELLIGEDINDSKKINCIELYLLCLAILFHDVGNIYEDRKNHQYLISEIYNYVRKDISKLHNEKRIISQLIATHSGETNRGDSDTIGSSEIILEEIQNLYTFDIDMRKIASILRLADELAEGVQRTSLFLEKHNFYYGDSSKFHIFAKQTTVSISKAQSRIALTYNISLEDENGEPLQFEEFKNQILFILNRIYKTDTERKYCKFFTFLLEPFKITTASMQFHKNGHMIDSIDNPFLKIVLTDLIKPDSYKVLFDNNVHNQVITITSLWQNLCTVNQIKYEIR